MPRIIAESEEPPGELPENLERVGGHFEEFQKNGRGWKALCPAHDDSNPSLSINVGKDGRILLHCHAGCPPEDVIRHAGLQMSDLSPGAGSRPRIIAKYDYCDRDGKLLYQSLRMEPKDFRVRRPNGSGGWIWRGVFEDVSRVPYRLAELLRTDDMQQVFVVEGEADVDRLRAEGFAATTNVGGAKKWRPEYNEHFESRHVVILPDNDDVGREHAIQVARNLAGVAASVRIVELPDIPVKGDVSDWFNSGRTSEELLAIVDHSVTFDESTFRRDDESENPSGKNPTSRRDTRRDESSTRRLVDSSNPSTCSVEPFPVDVFPKLLQDLIHSIAESLPCPPDFPGAMMLPVLGTLVGRKRCIEVKAGWQEYPLLWVAVVARSGERKTPSFQMVTQPLRIEQRKRQAQFLQELDEYERLDPKEREDTPRPRMKQILTTDTTIEALKDVLAGNPDGIIYPADELSGWVRSMSQYKGGRGDDRQHWLSIWAGVQIVSNRKGRDPILIDSPFVSITGGIQPDALVDLIEEGREDGLAPRVLFAYPDPVPNRDWTEDAVDDLGAYIGICNSLVDMPPAEEPVRFSPAAKRLWVEWVNAHRRDEPPDNLRPAWSKMEGYCARLALILFLARQVCNETRSVRVDVPSVDGATRLIAYFKSHARRAYARTADVSDTGRVGNALRWIKKRGGIVTARDVNRFGLTRDSEAAKELLADLEALGHGTVIKEARGSVVFTLDDSTGRRLDDSQET